IMGKLPQYTPHLAETHHIHKLDHPSGTAITIAEGIIDECPRISGWEDEGILWMNATEQEQEKMTADIARRAKEIPSDKLPVLALRKDEVPGIHVVSWESPVDAITITHSAKSRDGFALGAVMAAEWIASRKGIYTIDQMMDDIL
ncbi:dihydrodipicolinate reductase C-terminal domain-containing protein, partial [Duncaniella freteri]